MIFELVQDFSAAVSAMPQDHPRQRIVALLEEAIRRDIHFIARHTDDYPQALFQCLWNSGWWYDCPEAGQHYAEPEGGWSEPPPWSTDGAKLCDLLESWREMKEKSSPGFCWLRVGRPPFIPLGTQQLTKFQCDDRLELVGFISGSRRVAAAGRSVWIWDSDSGKELYCLGSVQSLGKNRLPTVVAAFSPDGTQFAAINFLDTLTLSDINGNTRGGVTIRGSGKPLVSFSCNGSRVFVRYNDKVIVSDAATGETLAEFAAHNAMVSPDGTRLARKMESSVMEILDVNTGQELARFPCDATRSSPTAFSPDGEYFVFWSKDRSVRVFHIETKQEICRLCGEGIRYLSSGSRIASVSGYDGTVRVWDIATGQELRDFRHESTVRSIAFSQDGRYLVSGSEVKDRISKETTRNGNFSGPTAIAIASPCPRIA